MAARVATMGPVLVQGRQKPGVVAAAYCNRKEHPAGHRSCVVADVSLVVAAGNPALQAQPLHSMEGRRLAGDHQVGFQQARLSPRLVGD